MAVDMKAQEFSMAGEGKREAKLREEVKGIGAQKVWPLIEDFCNLHKVFPFVSECWRVEGEEGKPGLIRYCKTVARDDGESFFWAKEKLLMIDSSQRRLSCQVLDNNLGLRYYVATVEVLPVVGGGEEEEGCCIEWSVVADPIDGTTFQDFQSDGASYLRSIAQTIQNILLS